MKKVLLFACILALSGCAAVDAYLMTKFDSTEYQQITEIRFYAERYSTQCEDPIASKTNANDLSSRTKLFELYSANLPRNGEGVQAATQLNEIAEGLTTKYNAGEKVSPLFCKLKFEGIWHSADVIRHVLANRPR